VKLTDEQSELVSHVAGLGRDKVLPRAAEWDELGTFPWDMHKLFSEQGLYGVVVPPEYGGFGGTAVDLALILDTLGRTSGDTNSLVLLEAQSLGSQPVVLAGTEAQKQAYLPGVASGESLWAFSLTEAESGSDAGSMRATAVRNGDGYVLNAAKVYCTNGNVADQIVLFAMTDPSAGVRGISAFAVPTTSPGFSVGRLERKMGMRGSPTAQIFFDDVHVPAEARLGEEGEGFAIAMRTLYKGRVAVSADCVGVMRYCVDYATQYAKTRVTWGQPIADRQGIQFKLADMEIMTETAAQMVYAAAQSVDDPDASRADRERLTAIAKCYASEMRERVASDAIQVLGGAGYMQDHPLERIYRDSKIYQIFEGTNEVQRMLIARHVLSR
jgi:alkylation response protein AidB-like acyl-CoA dehydrogenase